MSSKLDPVTFQVHFPATLTTDGTQWMQPNGWNLRKMTQQMYFFVFIQKKWMKTHMFSEKTLFKTIQWLERFIFHGTDILKLIFF